mgnify:CR=1 FL=1
MLSWLWPWARRGSPAQHAQPAPTLRSVGGQAPVEMATRPRLEVLLASQRAPDDLPIGRRHRVRERFQGLYASVFRGMGMDFEDTRAYQDGDDIRHMEWRVTARTGVAHIKRFRAEHGRTVLLLLDGRRQVAFGTRGAFKWVQAARAAAQLGSAAQHVGDRLGAVILRDAPSHTEFIAPRVGQRNLRRILSSYCEPLGAPTSEAADVDPSTAVEDGLHRTRASAQMGSLVFVIADMASWSPGLEQALIGLRGRCEVVLICLDDVADRTLPDIGPVTLGGPSGHAVLVDAGDRAARQRLAELWERDRQALLACCARIRVPVIAIATDSDVDATLRRALLEIGRRG